MRWYRRLRLKLLVVRAHRTIRLMDLAMKRDGWSRQQRRQAWRDVIAGRIEASDLLQ
jgi:hypothetical protein